MSSDESKHDACIDLSGEGAVATSGGVTAGSRGIAIGGSVNGNVTFGDVAEQPLPPRQLPPLVKYYVARPEERLCCKNAKNGASAFFCCI